MYNVEKYISACVRSLIDQTYPNLEMILVDDGSTDGCPAICDDFAAKYDNISVIHQENRGLSGARNTGIDRAKGELLCFVDSDDEVDGAMITRLYELAEQSGAGIVSSGVVPDEPVEGVFSSQQALEYILKETTNLTTSACGKLFKAELFDGIRFPEGLNFEDYATVPLLIDKAGRIAHTGDVMYSYRVDNPDSITHSTFSPKRMDYFTVSGMIEDFLKERYPSLLKHAINRRTRCAVSFFKQLAQSGQEQKEIRKALAKYTRRGILRYLFTPYKLTSKAYGLLISVCPPLAARLFARN